MGISFSLQQAQRRGNKPRDPHPRAAHRAADLETAGARREPKERPRAQHEGPACSPLRLDLKETAGFLVADARGRVVGRVEGPMYGSSAETPDALSVRFSRLRWRRRLVPATAIAAIDDRTKVIGLRIERDAIRVFL